MKEKKGKNKAFCDVNNHESGTFFSPFLVFSLFHVSIESNNKTKARRRFQTCFTPKPFFAFYAILFLFSCRAFSSFYHRNKTAPNFGIPCQASRRQRIFQFSDFNFSSFLCILCFIRPHWDIPLHFFRKKKKNAFIWLGCRDLVRIASHLLMLLREDKQNIEKMETFFFSISIRFQCFIRVFLFYVGKQRTVESQ